MSSDRLAVIVEGRVLDRSFYDRILIRNLHAARLGYTLYLAEEIEQPDAKSAGGKVGILKLHDFYQGNRTLFQETKAGKTAILCMLDRDFDHIKGTVKASDHIVYTQQADVEAEVFVNANLGSALSTELSIPIREAKLIADRLGDYISKLAHLWRDWIELCAIAAVIDARCSVRTSNPSEVNNPKFGPSDPILISRALASISAGGRVADIPSASKAAKLEVQKAFLLANEHSLVKGKWIPYYLDHEVRLITAGSLVDIKDFKTSIAKTCIDHIDFGGPWVDYYHSALEKVIAHH